MAEKSLNELSRDLRMLFTKGNDALQRDNFDYAIDLYNQILAKEPGLYECRKVLRTAQARKAGTGGGFFKKMLSSAGSSPQVARGHMALSKDPGEALRIAEQILNGDPTNSGAHKLVVEAATALELPKTAVMSLEILASNSPKDRDVAIKFANALADAVQVGKAEKILAKEPGLYECRKVLRTAQARKAGTGGGFFKKMLSSAGSSPQVARGHMALSKDPAEALRIAEQILNGDPTNSGAHKLVVEAATAL